MLAGESVQMELTVDEANEKYHAGCRAVVRHVAGNE